MAAVVTPRAEFLLGYGLRDDGWRGFVVAFAMVSVVPNLITPSAGERAIWAPVALLRTAWSVTSPTEGTGESPTRSRSGVGETLVVGTTTRELLTQVFPSRNRAC